MSEPFITPEMLSNGVVWYVAFLFSITVHEAAHAFAAMKMGDFTAYHGGQVTLNPVPHIRREPFGTVFIPVLSFFLSGWMMGWASAPYNPQWALQYPKRSALMALAGPTANLVIAVVTGIFIIAGISQGVFVRPEYVTFTQLTVAAEGGLWTHVAMLLSIMFSLNLLLFAFNLLPLPPLDGSGALPLFMSEDLARKYMMLMYRSSFAIIGILVAWQVFSYVFIPIYRMAIRILYFW